MKYVLVLLLSLPLSAQSRIASDFELAQMEKQLAQSRGFEAQLSGRLNVGDVRLARGESQLARREYETARQLAAAERQDARRASAMTRYAQATSYAALAEAKLGNGAAAFNLLEESLRYGSDDAETWNLYASSMRLMGHSTKAISAGRNAVAIAAGTNDPLDLAVYQHALAAALIAEGTTTEAETLLEEILAALRSERFRDLRREVARTESFEVYSAARGDVAAYVSLLNRVQLRLGDLYARRGATDAARLTYAAVLEGRSDDPTALAALARLASDPETRHRHYEAAFDANPFDPRLIREYRRAIRGAEPQIACSADCPAGTQMRRALARLERGDLRSARVSFDALIGAYPENQVLRALRRDTEGASTVALPTPPTPSAAELLDLLATFEKLTPQQRVELDTATFTSDVRFDGLPFSSGSVEGVRFRFGSPAQFSGDFSLAARLRLTYRILGVTSDNGEHILLLEPVRLEQMP